MTMNGHRRDSFILNLRDKQLILYLENGSYQRISCWLSFDLATIEFNDTKQYYIMKRALLVDAKDDILISYYN